LPLYETLGEHTPLILVWPFDYVHILYAMAVRVGLTLCTSLHAGA